MDEENRGSHESENRINGLYAYTVDGKECTREEYEAALAALDKLQETYKEKLYQVQVIPSERRDTAPHYKQGKIPNTERIFFFKSQGAHDSKDIDPYDLNTLQDNQWFLCVADKVNAVPGNLNKGSVEGVPLQRAPILREWIAKDDDTLRIGNIYAPRVTYVERNGTYRNDTGKPIDFFTDPKLIDQIDLPPSLHQKVASDLEAYNNGLTKALDAIQWPSLKGEMPYNDGTLHGVITTTYENRPYNLIAKVSIFRSSQIPHGSIKRESTFFDLNNYKRPISLENIKHIVQALGKPEKIISTVGDKGPSIECTWGSIVFQFDIGVLVQDPAYKVQVELPQVIDVTDQSRNSLEYDIKIHTDATGELVIKDRLYREVLGYTDSSIMKAHIGSIAYMLAPQLEDMLRSTIHKRPPEEYTLEYRERALRHHEQFTGPNGENAVERDFFYALNAIEPIMTHVPRFLHWDKEIVDGDPESADGMRGGSGNVTKRKVPTTGYRFGNLLMECHYISDNPAEVKKVILSAFLANMTAYLNRIEADATKQATYLPVFGQHYVTPESWYADPPPPVTDQVSYQQKKSLLDERFAALQKKWATFFLPAEKYVLDMSSDEMRVHIENQEYLRVTMEDIEKSLPALKKSPLGKYSSLNIDNLLEELKSKMQHFTEFKPSFLPSAEKLLAELQTFKDQVDRMRSFQIVINKCNAMFKERLTSPPFIVAFQKIFPEYGSTPLKTALSADLKPDETIEDRIAYLAKHTRDTLSSALNLGLAPESDIDLIETMGDYLKGIEISQKLVDEWTKLLLGKSQDPMLGIPGNTVDGMNIVFPTARTNAQGNLVYMHDPNNVTGTRNDGTQNFVLLGESVAINRDTKAEAPFAPVQFIMNNGSRNYHDIIIELDPFHSPVTTLPDHITYRSKNVISNPSYPLLTGNTTEIKATDAEMEILRKAREANSIFKSKVSVNETKQHTELQPSSRPSPRHQYLDPEVLEELGIPRKPLPKKEITFDALTVEQAARLLDTPLDELPQFLDGSIQHLHFQNARQFTEKTFEEVALSRIDDKTISDTLASLDGMKLELSRSESTPQKKQVVDGLAALQTEYKRRWTAIQAPGNFSQELKSAGFDIKDKEVKKIIAIACYHQLNSGVDSLKTVLQEIIRATNNTLLLNKVVQYALEKKSVEAEDVDRMKRSITDIIASDPEWNINDIDHIGLIALYALDKM